MVSSSVLERALFPKNILINKFVFGFSNDVIILSYSVNNSGLFLVLLL